jgi:hypothetical protein
MLLLLLMMMMMIAIYLCKFANSFFSLALPFDTELEIECAQKVSLNLQLGAFDCRFAPK